VLEKIEPEGEWIEFECCNCGQCAEPHVGGWDSVGEELCAAMGVSGRDCTPCSSEGDDIVDLGECALKFGDC